MIEDDEPWANLGFQEAQAVYESPSQNARVWSESWVAYSMFCPNCGRADISQYANNRPVADFACQSCHEDYELKSKKGRFGAKIVDGAYGAMISGARSLPPPSPSGLSRGSAVPPRCGRRPVLLETRRCLRSWRWAP